MNRLDAWAARHPVLTTIAVIAIIAGCLEYAHELDQEYSASIYWQMASTRSE
jgi:hypothetical protein